MRARSSGSRGASPGTITVRCFGPVEWSRTRGRVATIVNYDRYTYTAPADVAGSLGPHTDYAADAYTATDGVRRFVPRPDDGREGYVARAFQIGHSLLARDRAWDKATFDDYCLGKLAYDWVCHARQRLKPRPLKMEELFVPQRLQSMLLRTDSLPDELVDLSDDNAGRRIAELAALGREAAVARGIEHPDETELLGLGLMTAARGRPPLAAAASQLEIFVRDALFNFADENEEPMSAAVWDEVAERFENAVRDRLWDDQRRFNTWLYGKRSYLLQTIEKSATLPAADDRRKWVRRAMLAEAWKGLGQVNECLDAFAAAFERAIPRRLTVAEQRLYRSMYRRQACYGGFVLPLLLDVGDLLKHAVLDLWERPDDPQTQDVFQRMLLYRSQILPRVREMQRVARADLPLRDTVATEAAGFIQESAWEELTAHILERRGVKCPQCDAQLVCTVGAGRKSTSTVNVEVVCPVHGPLPSVRIATAEFVAAHAALQGEEFRSR